MAQLEHSNLLHFQLNKLSLLSVYIIIVINSIITQHNSRLSRATQSTK